MSWWSDDVRDARTGLKSPLPRADTCIVVTSPQLERVTAPDFIAGIDAEPMDELRARRAECQSLESSVSYCRRLAQGRLDIVSSELARRRDGESDVDLGTLISRLPGILADGPRTSTGAPRPIGAIAPTGVDDHLAHGLDLIVSSSVLASLGSLDEDELDELIERLSAYERSLSSVRRRLHQQIDALHEEMTRRYRSGEASVDSLLNL